MRLNVLNFNLQHTLDSGQFFRYDKIGEWYYCNERERFFKIRQEANKLIFEGTDEEHNKRLFGLDKNYEKIIAKLSEDKTLLPIIEKYKGLRIMQRDPWETLISFQCSIMSNIKKIKLNMNCLAKEFGREISLDGIKSFTFPEPGKLNDFERIRKCATGFRTKYIYEANKMVDDKYFEKLKKMKYEDAHTKLMELSGVAEKVADCVCLFALGKTEAFPVDVWISRIMTKLYFNGGNMKNKEIRKFAADRWGINAGYAQQFLYHWGRNL